MLNKNKRPYDAAKLPPAQRLRSNIVDLFASGQVPASRAQELIDDGAASGVLSLKGLEQRTARGNNTARTQDLRYINV